MFVKKLKFLRRLDLLKRLLYNMKETKKKAKKSVPMSCVNKKSSTTKLSVEVDEKDTPSSLTESIYPESAEFVEKEIHNTDFFPPCPSDQYTKTREGKLRSCSFSIKNIEPPLHKPTNTRAASASGGSFGIDVKPHVDQPPFDELTKSREAQWYRRRKYLIVLVLALMSIASLPVLFCKLSFHSYFLRALNL